MKVVIDISEHYYEILKYDVEHGNDYKPIVLIANGTPIPKGHGELIDRQSLKLSFFTLSRFYKTWNLGKTKIMGEIENAQTIIGASKESEE